MNAADLYLGRLATMQSLLPAPLSSSPDRLQRPFDIQNSIALPAVGVNGSAVLTYPVPPGWDGLITAIIFEVAAGGFQQGSGDLIARIVADGMALKGYDNIVTELGSVQTPRRTDGIQIYSGQLVQLTVDNIALNVGGAFLVGAFVGHIWQRG